MLIDALSRARENAIPIDIMRHGRLVREAEAAEFSHTDLEKLYLETMAK